MCELYALSSADPLCPQEDLSILQTHGAPAFGNEEGWGICWVRDGKPVLLKAAESPLYSHDYKGVVTSAPESKDWLIHLRAASEGGICLENTQPYLFELNKTQAVFAHNGDLPNVDTHPQFLAHKNERHGNADSECAMIILRHRLLGALSIETTWQIFCAFSAEMRELGPANFLIRIDGNLFAHSDQRKPVGSDELQTPGLTLLQSKTDVRLSSEPLSEDYVPLKRGDCLWIKDGLIIKQINNLE